MKFYVWYDNLLEELFTMEKSELDNDYSKFKEQLLFEKVILKLVDASNITEAFSAYKKKYHYEINNYSTLIN